MRFRVTSAAVMIPALAISAMSTQAGWRMRVHEGEGVTEFTVSNIDSLTFHEAYARGR